MRIAPRCATPETRRLDVKCHAVHACQGLLGFDGGVFSRLRTETIEKRGSSRVDLIFDSSNRLNVHVIHQKGPTTNIFPHFSDQGNEKKSPSYVICTCLCPAFFFSAPPAHGFSSRLISCSLSLYLEFILACPLPSLLSRCS